MWSPVGKGLASWHSLYLMVSCVFVTFPYDVLGEVWYLIVSIPDICLLPYFNLTEVHEKSSSEDNLLDLVCTTSTALTKSSSNARGI